jgi:hypothetical protein
MSNNWLYNIRNVVAGEPVQASVVNRPDTALEERTNYLKQRLDAAGAGQALFDSDASIAPDVKEGQPVFWNATTQQYELALAAVENDETTQTLVIQASADCLGIVYRKKSPTLGDIVLRGIVQLPALANAVDGTIEPGRYYLSSETPGKLVKQRPPATVGVCYVQGPKDNCSDNPWVVVMPQVRDFLESHIHYRFELVPRAAGTIVTSNGKVSITAADPTKQGWLPANHATFRGKAPAGAVFGYNIPAEMALLRVWPPMPMSAVAMLWDKGQNRVGATEIPLGRDGLAICNANGIWWMSDCVGDVPWSAGISSSSSSSSSSTQSTPECPRDEQMRVIVVFLHMLFGNDRNVVVSLEPAVNSPFKILNCDGLPAKTGCLTIDLDLNLTATDGATGGNVLKRIDAGTKFKSGWVTEGLVSGSAPIVITGSAGASVTRTLTAAEKTALGISDAGAVLAHQGLVKISFNDALVERELSPQIIRLSDTVERLYKDVPYIGFPVGQDSLIRVRFNVPSAGLGSGLKLIVRAQFLGLVAGTLPLLPGTYRRLPRPATGASTALVTTDTTLTFASGRAVTADTVVEVESAAFTVAEGDTVLVTLRRSLFGGVADAYLGEIGLMRLSGIVSVQ